jgi:cytochrome c
MNHRMNTFLRLLLLLGVAGSGTHAPPVLAAGDANHGAEVFAQECAECHSPREGKNKKGPSAFGVVGRKAGTAADFVYSDAMLQSGITWTPDRLDAYITNPKKVVPGGKMKYDGLADAKDRADLIAYLATLH